MKRSITKNMKARPMQKRALEKREALIAAGFKHFAAHGYDATTAAKIAAQANVASGTFYQNFDNKDDLLCSIALDMRAEIFDALPNSSDISKDISRDSLANEIGAILNALYEYHHEHRDIHIVLEQRRSVDSELDRILTVREREMEKKITQLVAPFKLKNKEETVFNLCYMAEGIVHRLVFSNSDVNSSRALEVAKRMFCDIIIAAKR